MLCCSRQLRNKRGREDHKETDSRNLVKENGSTRQRHRTWAKKESSHSGIQE